MEETSLDDFGTSDPTTASEDGPARDDETGAAAAGSGGDGADVNDVDGSDASATADSDGAGDADAERTGRPTVTAAWSDDAEACAACGEVSAWRWAQAGDMVCPACKEW